MDARRWRGLFWLTVAITVAAWPFGALFGDRLFSQRDLALHFWPKYLWLRNSVAAGQWPWWDPYLAGGQSAVADPLNQLFLLPALALRLLLPETLGFNLWVALPFPLMSTGAWLFFRRHASATAAALGAIAFATSGPIASTGNLPNLSWSVLFIPWMLWTVDECAARLRPTAVAGLAALFACQVCAGEPVTMAATAALLLVYAVWGADIPVTTNVASASRRSRLRVVGAVGIGLAAGAALAAIQLLPLADVAPRSARMATVISTEWSLHPLAALEFIAPTFFGDTGAARMASQSWLSALNGGREPFFYSTYFGVGALLLSTVGLLAPARRRWNILWMALGTLALFAAFGPHTPFYPAVLRVVPGVRMFRFPAKFLVFVSMSSAALTVSGWSSIERIHANAADGDVTTDSRPGSIYRPVVACGLLIAAIAGIAVIATLLFRESVATLIWQVAAWIGMPEPGLGAASLIASLPAHAARLMLLSLAAIGLLGLSLSQRAEAKLGMWVLFGLVVVDLAVTNGSVNPTSEKALLTLPSWATIVQQQPHERFYFGGRLHGFIQGGDPDGPTGVSLPAFADVHDARVFTVTRSVPTPSFPGMREITSTDISGMFPLQHAAFMEVFAGATSEQRRVALQRAGVRYCIVRQGPPGAPPLDRVPPLEGIALYDCDPQAARAIVRVSAEVVQSNQQQLLRLFKPDSVDAVLLRESPSSAIGVAGPPVAAFARFITDTSNLIELETGLPAGGGYVLLRDSYDPWWQADVDGQPVSVLQADALFRTVHVASGRHIVRFRYQPQPLLRGAIVTGATGVCLLIAVLWSLQRRRVHSSRRADSSNSTRLAQLP